MNFRYFKNLEKEHIRKCLSSHPVLLLSGTEQTGVVRTVEAILEEYTVDKERQEAEEMVWQGIHPDLILYDGRELTAEDARNLRQFATSCPAIWDRRFIIISYIHRPHYVVMPILLKLIEEPPDHFSMIVTTSNERRVLPTILSRSLQLKIRPSDESEVKWWLNRLGKEENDLRIKACGGDLNVAENLNLFVIQEWHRDWSAVLIGSDFKKSFLAIWTARLEEASESTQIACWDLLIQMIASVLNRNRFWVEVGLVGMEARNTTQSGFMNKMLSSTLLFKTYAISKVILTRG
jgi:hypothetical protein